MVLPSLPARERRDGERACTERHDGQLSCQPVSSAHDGESVQSDVTTDVVNELVARNNPLPLFYGASGSGKTVCGMAVVAYLDRPGTSPGACIRSNPVQGRLFTFNLAQATKTLLDQSPHLRSRGGDVFDIHAFEDTKADAREGVHRHGHRQESQGVHPRPVVINCDKASYADVIALFPEHLILVNAKLYMDTTLSVRQVFEELHKMGHRGSPTVMARWFEASWPAQDFPKNSFPNGLERRVPRRMRLSTGSRNNCPKTS
jgi:hypothetical protein